MISITTVIQTHFQHKHKTQADSVVSDTNDLLIPDFGSCRREERDTVLTMLTPTITQRAAHLVVLKISIHLCRSRPEKLNRLRNGRKLNSVTWFTTERREIRNFPYPSLFELTGRQRLTVKRGIRNVGQFLAAEVTNPGQNESQQMFALCDRMDKEGDTLDRDSSPNESPDRVKEEERGRMIGQNPENGSSTLFVSGNRKKRI